MEDLAVGNATADKHPRFAKDIALPFGEPGAEKVNLNVDSLWSGGPFAASVRDPSHTIVILCDGGPWRGAHGFFEKLNEVYCGRSRY